jgi:polysaccharide biosynthesis/export protein
MGSFRALMIAASLLGLCLVTSSSFAAPSTFGTPSRSTASRSSTPATTLSRSSTPAPATAFKEVPSAPGPGPVSEADYLIGSQDKLDVNVFQIMDLSKSVVVESNGTILLPLIGQVEASGRTVKALSEEIATKLGERYVKDPLVTVTVTESASRKVTVDGAVMQPGIYPIAGNTTLTQAVALARGTIEDANLRQVAIFRNEGDKRLAAVFDLSAIRTGKMPDPQVRPNDVIVVDTREGRRILRSLGTLVPFLYLFRPY